MRAEIFTWFGHARLSVHDSPWSAQCRKNLQWCWQVWGPHEQLLHKKYQKNNVPTKTYSIHCSTSCSKVIVNAVHMCANHYMAWKKTGDIQAYISITFVWNTEMFRLCNQVTQSSYTGCSYVMCYRYTHIRWHLIGTRLKMKHAGTVFKV